MGCIASDQPVEKVTLKLLMVDRAILHRRKATFTDFKVNADSCKGEVTAMKRFFGILVALMLLTACAAMAEAVTWNCPNGDGNDLTSAFCPNCGASRTGSADAAHARIQLEVNQIICFGEYEQDDDLENGVEPIEWIVLEVEQDKAFLISRYTIESQCYNETDGEITWEKCTLRSWLNDTFLKTAFSEADQAAILTTHVSNGANQQNREYATVGGADTDDKLYLMSYKEAWSYFKTDEERISEMTPYMATESNLSNRNWKTMHWLLRSPGHQQDFVIEVYETGKCYSSRPDAHRGVRPVMWLDLTKVLFAN